MARPRTPLISKEEVVRKALAILDSEGMSALSTRRLGAELNVNGASLYHHFTDKDAILEAVGASILSEMEVPEYDAESGFEWIIAVSHSQREVLLKHPEVIPLLSKGYLKVRTRAAYARSEAILRRAGVPEGMVALELDLILALILGSAIVLLMPDTVEAQPTSSRTIPAEQRPGGVEAAARAAEAFDRALREMLESMRNRYRSAQS